jgi:sterol desaturase/sphingolipid hydroxylase (fatty acid hydroxylase superfamily)
METYGKLLNIATPIFLGLFLIEKYFESRMGAKVIRGLDSVSSLSSGLTNVVKDILGLSVNIIGYTWLVEHIALFDIKESVWTYIIGFIAIDFYGYWGHRLSHQINFLWNRHIIHHSSEEFNLACALRQTVSAFVNYFTIFLIPAALLGVPAHVIAIIGPLHLFMQFWYHTRLIGKMGFLEYIIVTPSHHRVHHAINPEYLDKNHGQIFIIWDKLFGTFQEELPNVAPVYGVTRPVRTWNPIKINFQHFFLLLQDAWRTEKLWDKLRIWFMPTGWRPDDVKEKYPVFAINDVYNYEKFDTNGSRALIVWSWVQMLFNYFLLIYFFGYIGKIGIPNIFIYGAFVVMSVYAYTELMDKNPNAIYMEIIKSLIGLTLIYTMGDWFGASQYLPFYTYIAAAYFVLSVIVTAWFVLVDFKRETLKQAV